MPSELESIVGKKFPVLDDGFVRLIDFMGDDASVVQAARVSYGAGTKQLSDDRKLIRYLMRHQHTTPFEMCEVKLHVRVPMDIWRQWIRHRTANVNEYSTRYSLAIDATQPDAARTSGADRARIPSREAPARCRPTSANRLSRRETRDSAGGARGLRRADRGRRREGASPQGPAAFDLHGGVLEDRPAQSSQLPAPPPGRPPRRRKFASTRP